MTTTHLTDCGLVNGDAGEHDAAHCLCFLTHGDWCAACDRDDHDGCAEHYATTQPESAPAHTMSSHCRVAAEWQAFVERGAQPQEAMRVAVEATR